MTVLEIMIVLAIIGGRLPRALGLPRDDQGGSRRGLDRPDRGDAARQPARDRARRASPRRARSRQAASTRSRSAQGQIGIAAQRAACGRIEEAKKRALEKGKEQAPGQCRSGCADAAAIPETRDEARDGARRPSRRRRDVHRRCPIATSGDAEGQGLRSRQLRVNKGIKFKEVWVQHRDDSVTKGQVAIYFFPLGWSEKAVIELTDGERGVQRARLRADRPGRAPRRRAARRQRPHDEEHHGRPATRSGRTSSEARTRRASRCSR